MTVTLNPIAKEDKPILQSLYSLYLHDLSEFTESLDISRDGSFHFDSFEIIGEREGVTPYFLQEEQRIVGFLLLLERPFLKKEFDYCINDIFILRRYRRRGIAKSVLKDLFHQKQGKYYVVELIRNKSAVTFWKKLYMELNINYEEEKKWIDHEECLVQSFSTN